MSKVSSAALSSCESYFPKETRDFGYFIWTEATLFFGMLNIVNSMEGCEIGEEVVHIGSALLNTKALIDNGPTILKVANFINHEENRLFVRQYVVYFLKNDQDGMTITSDFIRVGYEGSVAAPEVTEKADNSRAHTARAFSANMSNLGAASKFTTVALVGLGAFVKFSALSLMEHGVIDQSSALFLMGLGFTTPSVVAFCTVLKLLASAAMLYAVIVEYGERNTFLEKVNSKSVEARNVEARMHLFRKESNPLDKTVTLKGQKLLEQHQDLIENFRPENQLFGTNKNDKIEAEKFLAEIAQDVQHKQNVELLKGLFISFTMFASCALGVGFLVINPASYAVMSKQVLLVVFYSAMMVNLLYDNHMKNYSEKLGSSGEGQLPATA